MLKRISLMLSIVSLAAIMSGCCAGPLGTYSCAGNCGDCNQNYGSAPLAYGPLDSLARMRQSLVCGSGCGEVYVGEWRSTPPDACDPCHGSQFVGGARPYVPFCWRPGLFLDLFGGLYGARFCDGCGHSFDQCGCGSGGGYVEAHIGSSHTTAPCRSCQTGQVHSHDHRTATQNTPRRMEADRRTARANAIRNGVSSSYAKEPTRYR